MMAAVLKLSLIHISDRHLDYIYSIKNKLEEAGIIRLEIDDRSEKIGYKIREAQLEKVPYMLIAGDKDIENGVIAVRSRKDGDLGTMTIDEFINKICDEVKTKKI